MRRHLLLTYHHRRQRLLSFVPASPLLRSLARRHTLAAALGLARPASGDSHPYSYPLPTAQPLRRPQLPAVPQPIAEELALWVTRPEPPAPAEEPSTPVEAERGRDEDLRWETEAADQEQQKAMTSPEGERSQAGPVASPPPPTVSRPGHARVIELGVASTPYDTIALDAPESDLAGISQRLPASPESASVSEVAAAPEVPNEAARLFRPHQDEAERSPQSWFRRLVEQARREQGPSIARPAPVSGSPGFPESIPGGASEQEPAPQTAADRVRRGRESGSTPALRPVSPLLVAERDQAADAGDSASAAAAAAARSPEPPSLTARRFLKPLLGVDLTGMTLYQDAQAARATEARAAAALSDAATIELAPQQEQASPEGLGLLAHELTHAMRHRQPRFLPPIVRPVSLSNVGEETELAAQGDEEQLAISVERQVRQQARVAFAATAPVTQPEQAVLPAPEAAAPVAANEPPTASVGQAPEAGPGHQSERGIWGKLPAPWEPLPAWLTAPASSSGLPASEIASGASLSSAPLAPSPPAITPGQPLPVSANGSTLPGEQSGSRRAGVERNLATPVSDEGQAPPATSEVRAPEADLDALARQVYTLLKRRLSAEQRRLLS
ncbi:eCIS core domain-containing protein [Thermogemmatispora tikiterensis]|uniref:eCIS core domain-containing protein n=1 Tax=Thermogemmatispora tikiterensis TaxID=1825093 RepID=A0A328VP07_9CHLR|nr:DUF4157 domain-containing protein [Thermogemmatispora tikiterensis]RAQ97520.1 hypothetical protein A4R35_18430 [Thermogemmatispora tikiterensis]